MNELGCSLVFIPNIKISSGEFQGPGLRFALPGWAKFSTDQGKWQTPTRVTINLFLGNSFLKGLSSLSLASANPVSL